MSYSHPPTISGNNVRNISGNTSGKIRKSGNTAHLRLSRNSSGCATNADHPGNISGKNGNNSGNVSGNVSGKAYRLLATCTTTKRNSGKNGHYSGHINSGRKLRHAAHSFQTNGVGG